jgi:hypothetical protein
MRKFCWLYRDRVTRRIYRVQKPRRRQAPPRYVVLWAPGNFLEVTPSDLRKDFEYVGRLEGAL